MKGKTPGDGNDPFGHFIETVYKVHVRYGLMR